MHPLSIPKAAPSVLSSSCAHVQRLLTPAPKPPLSCSCSEQGQHPVLRDLGQGGDQRGAGLPDHCPQRPQAGESRAGHVLVTC
eukprot:913530-Rhodomonas_salina.1